MTNNARPNLGGLFNGSTPADRVSSIAGRLGPRLVTAPPGKPDQRTATPVDSKAADAADATPPSGGQPAGSPRQNSAGRRSLAPTTPAAPIGGTEPPKVLGWIDPMRALEIYFSVLEA